MAILDLLGYILFFLGFLLILIGGLWFLVKMFVESIWWGLGGIVCGGIIQLIFLIKFWEDAKHPFLVYILGCIMAFGGVAISPELREAAVDESSYEEYENSFEEIENSSTP